MLSFPFTTRQMPPVNFTSHTIVVLMAHAAPKVLMALITVTAHIRLDMCRSLGLTL